MPTVRDAVALLLPSTTFGPGRECEIESDGSISAWRRPEPQPTQAEIDAAMLPAAKAQRIAAIKSKRDAVKGEGVTVGANRFHSDADSRIQQMGLVMMGASLPPVQWKTMGGTFVEMTPTLAGQIFAATAARDIAVFGHAEALIAQVNAAATPEDVAAIDIEAGWPA